LKDLSKGKADAARLQSRRSDLIKERLKLVIVVPVKQYDLKVLRRERPG